MRDMESKCPENECWLKWESGPWLAGRKPHRFVVLHSERLLIAESNSFLFPEVYVFFSLLPL